MNVMIPSQLRSYTHASRVECSGDTLGAVLDELDRRFPGLRFRIIDEQDRIRRHIHIFINKEMTQGLHQPVTDADEIRIIGALSGG
ncbi:MAG: MoaD/ThiS family protein [Bellilinea sp.]